MSVPGIQWVQSEDIKDYAGLTQPIFLPQEAKEGQALVFILASSHCPSYIQIQELGSSYAASGLEAI